MNLIRIAAVGLLVTMGCAGWPNLHGRSDRLRRRSDDATVAQMGVL